MRVKIITIVAIVCFSLLGFYLYTDLREMKGDLAQIKEEKKVVKPKPKPKVVKPKPRPKKKTKVTKKRSGKKHYRITYGRAPDVVSKPHFVPENKEGYYQDPVTKRWYWKGD